MHTSLFNSKALNFASLSDEYSLYPQASCITFGFPNRLKIIVCLIAYRSPAHVGGIYPNHFPVYCCDPVNVDRE